MKTLKIAIKIFIFFTVLTGIIYPLFITLISQFIFPYQANGSLITRKDGEIIGSELIAQKSDTVIYFSSRPSAVSYNPLPSGGSNWGLTNNKLKDSVNNREKHFISNNQTTGSSEIPSEMLFSSASGLDPHISPRSALLQAERISNARHFDSGQREKLIQCIRSRTERPQFLILGEERVNVLLLNLDIDKIK